MADFAPVTTLNQALERAARDFPGKGFGVFDARGRRAQFFTFGALWDAASAMAGRMARAGLAAQEPIIIALPTSWDWLRCWWGAVLLGAYPLAVSSGTTLAAAEAGRFKLEQVRNHVGARLIVAQSAFRNQLLTAGQDNLANAMVTPDELDAMPLQHVDKPGPHPDHLAFLQLTSGSTGRPRAVMIPHRAAIHNPLASSEAMGKPYGQDIHSITEAMVCWLPLHHDMGLIGCMMLPLLTGLNSWLMRPEAFLARPGVWLENLARYGQTFAPAPNFAYQLCLERLSTSDLSGLDLSGWRAALTGAEMVRLETVTAFCNHFAPFGFAPEALRPCYGLAECTLAVTFDSRGSGVRSQQLPCGADSSSPSSRVVSNGEPIRDTDIEIRDPSGACLPEGEIGEVCVRGPGMFLGYYRDEEATRDCFDGNWLRTGDLGFLRDGELYLTGRIKDLLIIRGQNMMPEDLERVADSVSGGGGLMRSAAFSITRGTAGEEAVLIVETQEREPERLHAMARDIRLAVANATGLPLADVAFVKRGKIPRTSSGKMQRSALRQHYQNGLLELL